MKSLVADNAFNPLFRNYCTVKAHSWVNAANGAKTQKTLGGYACNNKAYLIGMSVNAYTPVVIADPNYYRA